MEGNVISAAVINASVQHHWSFYCLEICQLCSGTSVFDPYVAAYALWVGRKLQLQKCQLDRTFVHSVWTKQAEIQPQINY